ncbi:hypothetical protein FNH05_08585 [Amycolatopsis rhizosphaerae]|uniref:Small secreted protein n=1 Tax=Amycolatopsis rhizosphaerae TaxID=2053003 RepID=A0A558D5K5_9PSEU|nr:hypothetical protein [Amycolatopsis rhizosphaerae]TVT56291.1 hypothetical protein FNH05_08585 [Amycolatopsis rhizosphaerae]
MRPRPLAAALAGFATLTLAACSSHQDASGASGSGAAAVNSAAVTWSDHVCEVVRAGGVKLSQLPAVDPSAPARAKDSLVTYLGSLSEALTELAGGIQREGVPPVHDGQATLERAMSTLDASKSSVDTAKAKLAAAAVTDQATFEQAVREASTAFQRLGTTDGPTKDLKDNPELAQAFTQAPNCRNLDTA